MALAVAGSKVSTVPLSSVFDFTFGRPFCRDNPYITPSQTIKPFPDEQPIFVDVKTDRPLTFGTIRQDALRIGAGFEALGLHFTDTVTLPATPTCPEPTIAPVVIVQLPNCLQMAPITMGILAAGLTASMASPALTATELAWILENSRSKVVVTSTCNAKSVQEALAMQKDTEYFKGVKIFTVDVGGDPYPVAEKSQRQVLKGTQDWKELLCDASKLQFNSKLIQSHEWRNRTAVILWSSGTSGRSKGVLLSHSALNFSQACLWGAADYYQGQHQKCLGYIPFYHVFGLISIFLLSITTGATVYTMSSFNLETMLKSIPKYKITYLHMAPPIAVMLLKAPIVDKYLEKKPSGKNAFSSVTAGIAGGAPLSHEIIAQVFKKFGFRIRLGYGMSEACSITSQPGLKAVDLHYQAGNSGRPHPGVEIMIAKEGQDFKGKIIPVKINEPGEILIRSPQLMSAYLPIGGLVPGCHLDMTATQETLTSDGWLRSGDVGTLDAGGFLRITDRIKEMIKVRAFQVAPAELEALLCSFDKVSDAGVISIYDEGEATEWPRAFVIPQKSDLSEKELLDLSQEIKKLVESRTAKYKWLIGGLVFVKAIPKSPSGKILRRLMKAKEPEGFEVKLYQRKKRPSKL